VAFYSRQTVHAFTLRSLFNGHLSRLANGYLSIPNANKTFPQGPVKKGLINGVYKGLFLTIKGDNFLYLLFTVSGFVNKQLRKNKITPLPLDNSHVCLSSVPKMAIVERFNCVCKIILVFSQILI